MIYPETTKLRNNHKISRVIRGCWQLAGDHGKVDSQSAIDAMETFLDAGITTFDCADIYTGVEEMLGQFITKIKQQRGTSAADEIKIHTKLVPDLGLLKSISEKQIESIIDRSLNRLNLDQLHLVQFFWWDMDIGHPVEALEVLKKCRDKGKIANLGVTNWDAKESAVFQDAGFDIISTQVQYSLLDRRPSDKLSPWCSNNQVGLLCYGTLAGGFLTEKWLDQPDPGFQFENRSLIKYRLIIDEFGSWEDFQGLLTLLKSIASQYQVSLSAVATRWVLDQPQVSATIVGARYARHLPATLEIFTFTLTKEDHLKITTYLSRCSMVNGPVYSVERDREGRHGRIMKYNLNTHQSSITNKNQ